MDLPFDKIVERIDTRTFLTQLAPSLAFMLAVAVLAASGCSWADIRHEIAGLDEFEGSVSAALLALVWFLSAQIISLATRPLVRLFEGYWGDSAAAQWARTRLVARQQARRERLRESGSESAYSQRYFTFPARGDVELLPTRLGNTMRAAESYPGDDERYGIDAVFFWPRLYFVVPELLRTTMGQARGDLERHVVSSALSALLVPVSLAFILWRTPTLLGAGFAVVAAILSWLSYEGAIQAAVTFGEVLRTAFDLHRRELLVKFDLEPPATLDEERALWKALGQQLYRRGASEPGLIRFKPPAAEKPQDKSSIPPADES